VPFLDYFFNEPTKSSLIGEKLPNLVTLVVTLNADMPSVVAPKKWLSSSSSSSF
jgi:hypothetical protein